MYHALRFALAMPAINVHQAACVGYYRSGGVGAFDIPDFILEHLSGYFGVFHGKDAAKSATLCRIGEFDDLSAMDVG